MSFIGTSTAGGGFNAYGGGSKVYNGGQSAPTSGTVDPTGYIERSVSQSRSGLAQAALARLKQNIANGSLTPQSNVTGTILGALNPSINPNLQTSADSGIQLIGRPIVSPTQVQTGPIAQGGNPPHSDTPVQLLNGSNPPQPVAQGGNPPTQNSGGGPLSPIVRPLTIDNLGQIQLPSASTLSLDPDLVAQMAAATHQAQQQLQALQQQQQQLSQQYAVNARQQTNAEPDVLNQILNAYAGRGLAHSSGYGQSVQSENDRYMQALDQLFSNTQNQLNNVSLQGSQVPTTLDSLIAQLQGTQAQRNVAQAGQLALNQQLANALNPDTNKQFVAVNNDIDKAMALKAGYSLDQIVNALGSTATGLGNIPSSAQNIIYAGKAGNGVNGKTAVGKDRNETEKLLELLHNS